MRKKMRKKKRIISLVIVISLVLTSITLEPVKTNAQMGKTSSNVKISSMIKPTSLGEVPNTDNALWITEIYPNDVDRSATYGNQSDLMEYVEITNTGNEDISFNNGYGLYYEYPSGNANVMKNLTVTDGNSSIDVVVKARETVVIWNQRTDVTGGPSEEQFRVAMNIPDNIQVLRCSGQAGFVGDNRGFAIKKADGTSVSYFHYTTAVDTADGLAVHLVIPDFGAEMLTYEQLKPTSAGIVYYPQLNGKGSISSLIDTTPEGLYITEIRPNDSNRDEQFGSGINDVMECLELANTTDQGIHLNDEYQLNYVTKANSKKTLAITSVDRSSTDCVIPAHSTAVIWCDRQNFLVAGRDYAKWPTEAEFRTAYTIPESSPVFVMTNQNGISNRQKGFELSKINFDNTKSIVSYYFWDGVLDVVDNKSVELKVNPEGPEMLVATACVVTTMGTVNETQITYPTDDQSIPQLSLQKETDTYVQGDFIRIPYSYGGTVTMPVTSIDLYYKTSAMTSFKREKTTSFDIYNKHYIFIPSDVVLNSDYVDYYVKAWNAYRVTMTDVRRLTNNKIMNQTGLDVRVDNTAGIDSKKVSGLVYVSAKNQSDSSQPVSVSLDGSELTTQNSLMAGAFYTFSYTGIDAYFKNGLTSGANVIKLMAKCSEIPTNASMAVLVNGSYFTYNIDGSATVELVIRPGTYGSTWESETAANNDDFTISNIALSLVDGSIIHPTSFVNENGTALDYTSATKMGDSTGCNMAAKAVFNIPASAIDASAVSIDTTALTDGLHTLVIASGTEERTITLNVDNIEEDRVQKDIVDYNMGIKINASADSISATISGNLIGDQISVYEAKTLDSVKVLEGTSDSTYGSMPESGDSVTSSADGEFPYQIYEISTDGDQNESIRFDITAASNYNRDVQLYALNVTNNKWEILNIDTENGVSTSVIPIENRIKDGKVTVLVQARGVEYTPYTTEDTKTTVKNEYSWDGTTVPDQYDFSFVWITDTQYYSEQYLSNFDAITDWILKNRENLSIENVIHTGDLVDEFNEEYEFKNASDQLMKFDDAGLPYGVLAGNHDVANGNERYDLYFKYFGKERYQDNAYYGGTYKNNLGHYDLMTIDGQEMLLIYMSWDIYTQEISWINQVLEQYPERKAILSIHGGINANADQSYFSDLLMDQVCKTHSNVFAVLNGHFHGSSMNFVGYDDNGDGVNDRTVYQICTDYQSAPEGGQGYIKMIYFDLKNDKLYMNSYSPVLDDINYYDTSKLSDYGAGAIAKDIDIMDLRVDFDTEETKTLTVFKTSATLLTDTEIGTGTVSEKTDIVLNAQIGDKKTVYAVEKDSEGNVVAYTALSKIVTDSNKQYTISFDSQGGTSVISQVITEGTVAVQPEVPSYTGCTFGGWYKDINFQNVWNFATDTIAVDTVLYARWIQSSEPPTATQMPPEPLTTIATDGCGKRKLLR